jgi:lipopolysaccharide assembly outer membrane protein LptD (OstA)
LLIFRYSAYKLLTLLFVFPFMLPAQQEPEKAQTDTARINAPEGIQQVLDSLSTGVQDSANVSEIDTTAQDSLIDPSVLKTLVNYHAEDSMAIVIAENKAYLYKQAHIDYGNVSLDAGYIELDWATNEVYARGIPDSTGKIVQNPIFKQGEDTYETDEIRYNFSTNKALIKTVITKEGESYLHGDIIKRQDETTFYIKHTSFTTCNKRHPHFEITTQKAKVIVGDRIVTGPANLVVADVPTPVILPFGFFPAQDRRASGFIIPTFNTHEGKGFGLVNGGYYFNFSDYIDLTVTGEVYSRGGWGVRGLSNYRKRYRYNGTLEMRFNKTQIGDPRYEAYGEFIQSEDLRIRWTHNQDPKARPDLRFSASLDLANPTFNRFNTIDPNDYLQNTTTSSISLDKRWLGSPFSLTASAFHTQNNNTKDFTLSLPKMALTMQRIFPLKRKNRVGSEKWFERIGMNYAAATEARIDANYDSLSAGVENIGEELRTGLNHTFNFSTNERILNFLSLSPSINFNSKWYPSRQDYRFEENDSLVIDTLPGFSTVNTFSVGAQLSTKVYGTFQYRKGRIKAIRHMMTPQIGFTYRPDFGTEFWGIWQQLEDSTGETQYFDRFGGYLYGSAGRGVNGSVTMNLGNNLEMKVRSDKDSTGERKVKLLDRLNFSTSYNIAASSFNWAPLSITAQSSVLKNRVSLTYQGIFDFYGFDPELNQRVNRSARDVNGQWARNTSSNFSVNMRWKGNLGPERKQQKSSSALGLEDDDINYLKMDRYMDFSMPWSFDIRYNYLISKPGLESRVSTHAIGLVFQIDPTPNWHLNVSTGYDLVQQEITYTRLNITRDLHCWELRIDWVPFGFQQSYMIGINIKASSFQDAKLERRRNLGDF